MPPSNTFSRLFSHSPIRPLQQHMAKVSECSEQLNSFFQAVYANDWQAAESLYNEISRIENSADDDKKNIRLHPPKGIARGIGAIDLKVVGTIFTLWVVTLPAGTGLSILFFFVFKGIFLS